MRCVEFGDSAESASTTVRNGSSGMTIDTMTPQANDERHPMTQYLDSEDRSYTKVYKVCTP
jgi:hypothetical protein